MQYMRLTGIAAGFFIFSAFSIDANAQLAVSANDGRVTLVDGAITILDNPLPDSVMLLDLGVSPPKLLAELQAPVSVIGPPSSVAIAPDEAFALVTAAMKLDPADPKKMVPDNRVSVIDLTASPPSVTATVEAGNGAAGVAIHPAGTLALVANRAEGTVSIFTIAGATLTAAGKVPLGDAKSGPSSVAFTPDGKMALVSRDGDHKISVLTIDGSKVEPAKRDINAGLRPYGLDASARGDVAVVANVGIGTGDADTVSLIDVKAAPPRVVDTITVGQSPEGIKFSPDGQYIAVTVLNGSNKPKASPFYNDYGLLVVLSVTGAKLAKVTEAKIGHYCQGSAWSKDGKTVLVQCMIEQELQIFDFDGKALKPAGAIKVKGGPAGIATAQR